ncbi:MAG: nickel pincer cofactor biosynthesis protein LarB [Planctomycetaceae bacterium]|nr:nickel pincer cofactor biosynthesis protein LarB [Planctomycetaceae bacterium]
MTSSTLESLLADVAGGRIAVPEALAQLPSAVSGSALTAEATVDLDRARRCGFPEVVFAQGKTAAAVVEIFERQHASGQRCFATRVSDEQAAAVRVRFPEVLENPVARTVRVGAPPDIQGTVVVVTAGTSDRPVAEEALETLHWMGCETDLVVDVGVAGPHRLPAQLKRLERADAIVVAAGMEGALPSVVGGWVACPVIAVPTSVGYGASFGGLAALLGMLNSCASNVTVVNIDAGFKAGYVAGMIARGRAT